MKNNRQDLLDALNLAKPALAVQEFIPVLTHYCFDRATVSAFNDVLAIQLAVDSDLHCAIHGATLQKILAKMDGEVVELVQGESEVAIKSGKDGRSQIRLPIIDKSQFLFDIPAAEPKASFKLSKDFLKAMALTLKTVGSNAGHPQELGVTLGLDGEMVDLYSTDNVTISAGSAKVSKVAGKLDSAVILPTPFCETLLAMASAIGDDEIMLEFGEGYVLADLTGDDLVFSRLVDQTEPYDFESIISNHVPEDAEAQAFTIPTQFLGTMGRASILMSSDTDKEVKINLEGNKLLISGKGKLGELDDSIALEEEHDPASFHIDPIFVERGAAMCEKMAFLEHSVVFFSHNFLHMVSHNVSDN